MEESFLKMLFLAIRRLKNKDFMQKEWISILLFDDCTGLSPNLLISWWQISFLDLFLGGYSVTMNLGLFIVHFQPLSLN